MNNVLGRDTSSGLKEGKHSVSRGEEGLTSDGWKQVRRG